MYIKRLLNRLVIQKRVSIMIEHLLAFLTFIENLATNCLHVRIYLHHWFYTYTQINPDLIEIYRN